MNLKTSAEVIISKWRKNSNYKYSQNICFCQNAIQNLSPFISPLQYKNYEVLIEGALLLSPTYPQQFPLILHYSSPFS